MRKRCGGCGSGFQGHKTCVADRKLRKSEKIPKNIFTFQELSFLRVFSSAVDEEVPVRVGEIDMEVATEDGSVPSLAFFERDCLFLCARERVSFGSSSSAWVFLP